MSGGTVPPTGNIVLYTGSTSIRGVFGISNLLAARALTNLEPGPQPPSSGSLAMSLFRGQKVLQPPSTIRLTNATTSGGTVSWTAPSVAALSNYGFYIGSSFGISNVVPLTNVTGLSNAFSAALVPGTSYFVTVFTRNTSNGVSATASSGAQAFPGVVAAPTISFVVGYSASACSFPAVSGTAPITYTAWFGSNTTYGSGTAILTINQNSSPIYFTSSIAMPSFYAIVQASNAVGVTTGTASALQTFVGTASSFASYTSPVDVISGYNYDFAGSSGYFVLSGSSLHVLYDDGSLYTTITLPATGIQIAWARTFATTMYVLSTGYISTINLTNLVAPPTSVATYSTITGIATDGTNLYSTHTNGGNMQLYVLNPSTGSVGSVLYAVAGQAGFKMTYNSSNSRLYIPSSNTSTGVYSTYSMTTAGGSVITYPITQANRYVEFDGLFNAMLFTDGASQIYKLASPWTGTPEVLAGISSAGAIINGNALTTARFNAPQMCRMDTITAGLLVCDTTNNSIRRVV
jgi:hypothetical protein